MSKKHNTKHDRSPSRYKLRLRKRGLGATPRMKWSHCDGLMSQDAIRRALEALR